MLTDAQVELFNTQGFLVIENVLDEETVLRPLKAEYNARLCPDVSVCETNRGT